MSPRLKMWMPPVAVVAVALLSVPAADLYYESSWGAGCARCHEIAIDYDVWRHSAHQKINCVECHASSLRTNLRRVATHIKGDVPVQVHLGADDIGAMLPRCRNCHQQEFAQWSSSAHSTTYGRVFTDREHNGKRLLNDDCLRCHGMHFDGGIESLVEQVSTSGPWRLRDAAYLNRPAIPCMSCHSIHRQGAPLAKPQQRGERAGGDRAAVGRVVRSPDEGPRRGGEPSSAGDSRGIARGPDESGPKAGDLLPVPRSAIGHAGGQR